MPITGDFHWLYELSHNATLLFLIPFCKALQHSTNTPTFWHCHDFTGSLQREDCRCLPACRSPSVCKVARGIDRRVTFRLEMSRLARRLKCKRPIPVVSLIACRIAGAYEYAHSRTCHGMPSTYPHDGKAVVPSLVQ